VFVAFAVDIGYLCMARAQAQRCADSAALAAATSIASDAWLSDDIEDLHTVARANALKFATLNQVRSEDVILDANFSNDLDGDVMIGRLDNLASREEEPSLVDPEESNTVLVRVRCDAEENPVRLFFARILGIGTAEISAEAAAVFERDNVVGFRPTEYTGNSGLMPFAVSVEDWEELVESMDGDDEREFADEWTYDPETQTVTPGSDGKPELRIFPDKRQGNSITPGNFGTVDIGNTNNSTSELSRQIREGISPDDMKHYNGELKLDQNGELYLNGDTGISASIESALAEAVGQSRSICLYGEVTGRGNTTRYKIVGFAGIRVVEHSLQGGNKYVTVQPALAMDTSAIVGEADASYFVGPAVYLVR
jgi:hypothetical protein